jgi:hypothetical protein
MRVALALAWGNVVAPDVVSGSGTTADQGEIWIAARSDGASGAEAKSLDGSTQEKFDSIMSEIKPGAYIHLGRGVFVTRGVHLKNNWRIKGSGKNKTTIKLADNVLATDGPQYASVLSNFDFEGFYDRVQISDLTLDCNRANQPSFNKGYRGSLQALTTAVRHAKITRVRALGTWANPGEGFPFSVLSSGSTDASNRIEIDSCENLDSKGNLTAISAFDQGGGRISGFIRNCLVTNNPNGAAFGSGGWKNFRVSRNRTFNMGAGIVIDTHGYENVLIEGNHFYGTQRYGILYNGSGQYKNIVIRNNFVEMEKSAEWGLVTGNATVTTRIYNNTFIQSSLVRPVFWVGSKTKGILRSNVVDETIRSDLSRADHVRLRNNRDIRGRRVRLRLSEKR